MAKQQWEDNRLQFPRLISEIRGVLTKEQEEQLCESMDLAPGDLKILFVRAEIEWMRAKDGMLKTKGKRPRQYTPEQEIEDYDYHSSISL